MQLGLQCIDILLPCEPFSVSGNSYIDYNDKSLVIPFHYVGKRERCTCGETYKVHQKRRIRLAAPPEGLLRKVWWEVDYCVYRCDNCDYFITQDIPFRFGKTRCTSYLAKMVCDDLDCNARTIRDCAAAFGLGWDTVKNIHKEYLSLAHGLSGVPDAPKVCVVDEFSVEKRHKYATLVINAETKESLYLHKGNSKEDFRPFFKEHKSSWYKGIKAFAMDQNAQYDSVVKEEAPWAMVIADYFHILKNYVEGVVDKVRLRTARDYLKTGSRRLYEEWKGSKRLLAKRLLGEEDVDDEKEWEAQFRLRMMMDSCHELDVCLHMKELLQKMFDECRDEKRMEKEWDSWCEMAKASGIPELVRFAENKDKRRTQILNHAKMPISSGVIEGCMNKIKVIKRTAFGFRDYDYFFDRIWYAFLPVPKKNKVRDMVWQLYGLDSSDFLASALDQQKIG